ncbi:MAG: hypothetical protein INR68_08545 [Methylobacterium mesophilicum]|nr:hypothetical protein [Methylobacterium mesophilicum]
MRLQALLLSATLACGAFAATPASADRLHDQIEADSYGNLVVWSRAGYKRIVVGKGHLAQQMRDYARTDAPRVVYSTQPSSDTAPAYRDEDCYRPPVFVKGRGYMYVLAEGEMPELSPCQTRR